ncbi:MAG: SRPBCC family protein [Gulosibacter sp.]|uniref:SRPBCC family protein n=1 Tax=Gulosibacter sp. TaxID=2817531 RepID=UPI003F91F2AB
MPVTHVNKDTQALTMQIVADFPVPVARLWDAYADPRQIEKFWGPVEYPARFTRHDMYPGGISRYAMYGPGGDVSRGYWEFLNVDAPHSFEVLDGFAREDGEPNRDMPSMRMVFNFLETAEGSRLDMTTYFNSLAEFESLFEMGMEEGTLSAMSQIDGVLADLRAYSADLPVAAEPLGDTKLRVSRLIRGSVEQVWAAHHEPELLKQWQLGPDGWALVECEVATEVGESYRYEWAPTTAEGEAFGFTGEVLESHAPFREVTTEQMIGMDGPPARNELTLIPAAGGTLLTLVIEYPSAEVREMVINTGMTEGMEASYARLEQQVLKAA